MKDQKMGIGTACIHAGNIEDQFGAQTPPVYRTSTFHFAGPDQFKARMNPASPEYTGYVYSRSNNPTVAMLQNRLAAIENAKYCVAFGSGTGAISGVLLGILKKGDHAIYGDVIYSSTYHLFTETLPRFGIDTTMANATNLEELEKAIRPETKMIYVETPANPTLKCCDLKAIADLCKKHGIISVSDNTFASAYNTKPLDLGFDIVLESSTKYVNGHGDCLGGFVCVNDEKLHYLVKEEGIHFIGAIMAPDVAYLHLRGLKTFHIRVERHNENALKVAEFFEKHPKIDKVYYPGLPSHPEYEIAKKQMAGGGGMVVVEVKGGLEGANTFCANLKMAGYAVSLGDADTLVEHAATMTHASRTPEERAAVGIGEGQLRISVGLEDAEDIIADFAQALEAVKA
ncbi:MAG: PLP-dependent aspartate aminotransferase family protein [Erysipelotrichaceae bacterium]|jgi:methionine-gamma-lyase|nr:PLP-dependent aspartate aminotransferase family protein [Erysipelotrichaceae bacterium]